MSWCILVNTTPKYMQFAEVQIACIRNYSDLLEKDRKTYPDLLEKDRKTYPDLLEKDRKTYPDLLEQVPIYLATELTAENEYVKRILELPNVFLLHLQDSETDFLESRVASFQYLNEYKYILPLQDDFWLDRAPDYKLLDEAITIMESDRTVQSIRLMPCPGPLSNIDYLPNLYSSRWKLLSDSDSVLFTFQATIWRTKPYIIFLQTLIELNKPEFISYKQIVSWSKYCISANIAENTEGQALFKRLCMSPELKHLSIERRGKQANAVFKAPWPYRPTAVVHGILQPWAKEFMEREGF